MNGLGPASPHLIIALACSLGSCPFLLFFTVCFILRRIQRLPSYWLVFQFKAVLNVNASHHFHTEGAVHHAVEAGSTGRSSLPLIVTACLLLLSMWSVCCGLRLDVDTP